jgi:hypothetical protein
MRRPALRCCSGTICLRSSLTGAHCTQGTPSTKAWEGMVLYILSVMLSFSCNVFCSGFRRLFSLAGVKWSMTRWIRMRPWDWMENAAVGLNGECDRGLNGECDRGIEWRMWVNWPNETFKRLIGSHGDEVLCLMKRPKSLNWTLWTCVYDLPEKTRRWSKLLIRTLCWD